MLLEKVGRAFIRLASIPGGSGKKREEFLGQNGFSSLDNFRKLTTRDIYEMYVESGRFGFPIVIDGYFLPKTLTEIFRAGEQAKVPLLLGWNSEEIPGKAFM